MPEHAKSPNFWKKVAMEVIIHSSPRYDRVDPYYYQQSALKTGTGTVAKKIGEIVQARLPQAGKKPIILDIAAGTGITARCLQNLGYSTIAADLHQNVLAYAVEQDPAVCAVLADMNKQLPFQDGLLDGVVTSGANRFIKDVGSFSEAAHQILRPGGIFIWPINPLESFEWKLLARLSQPPTLFTIVGKLKQTGFSIDVISDYSHPLHYVVATK